GRRAAPDAQPRPGAPAQFVGEHLEMVFLPEERREVRREAVHELLPLGLGPGVARALEPVEVAGEARMTERAQAARQPAVDHRLLRGTKMDARPLADQRADPIEILSVDREIASPGRQWCRTRRNGESGAHSDW